MGRRNASRSLHMCFRSLASCNFFPPSLPTKLPPKRALSPTPPSSYIFLPPPLPLLCTLVETSHRSPPPSPLLSPLKKASSNSAHTRFSLPFGNKERRRNINVIKMLLRGGGEGGGRARKGKSFYSKKLRSMISTVAEVICV